MLKYLDEEGLKEYSKEVKSYVDSKSNSNNHTHSLAQVTGAASSADVNALKNRVSSLEAASGSGNIDLSGYVTETELTAKNYADKNYVQTYVNGAISGGGNVDLTGYATEQYVDNAIAQVPTYAAGTGISITADNKISVDAAESVSTSSTKPVTSKAVANALSNKQDKLTAGTGISISGNTISATGSGTGASSLETTDQSGLSINDNVISLKVGGVVRGDVAQTSSTDFNHNDTAYKAWQEQSRQNIGAISESDLFEYLNCKEDDVYISGDAQKRAAVRKKIMAVSYDSAEVYSLTDDEKLNARRNIGAGTSDLTSNDVMDIVRPEFGNYVSKSELPKYAEKGTFNTLRCSITLKDGEETAGFNLGILASCCVATLSGISESDDFSFTQDRTVLTRDNFQKVHVTVINTTNTFIQIHSTAEARHYQVDVIYVP